MPTSSFITKANAQYNQPRIRLVYDGSNYDNRVIDISFRKVATLESGTAAITVDNTDNTFNDPITTPGELYIDVSVQIFYDDLAEYHTIFTGATERLEYHDKSVVMYVRDKMTIMLEKRLGTYDTPINFTTYNPASLAWNILTDYGGLDDTASSANTDIDYDRWDDWFTWCDGTAFALSAKFSGMTLNNALRKIAELSHSYIFVNRLGKISFGPPYDTALIAETGGYGKYDTTNTRDWSTVTHKENLVNDLEIFYTFTPADGDWAGSQTGTLTASETAYGTRNHVEQDRVVWHDDANSAADWGIRIFAQIGWEECDVVFTTFLQGIIEDVGATCLIYNEEYDLSYTGLIYEILVNIPATTAQITIVNISADPTLVEIFR